MDKGSKKMAAKKKATPKKKKVELGGIVPARITEKAVTVVTITYNAEHGGDSYTAHILKSMTTPAGLLYKGSSYDDMTREIDTVLDEDDAYLVQQQERQEANQ